jgi:hypothetical protein
MARFEEATIGCIIAILAVAFSPARAASFAGGTGDPENPYQIATAEQLLSIGSDPNLLNKHFILIADIDLAPHVFDRAVIAPDIDVGEYSFSGSLDGKGHVVRNLTIAAPYKNYVGLFGSIEGGTINDVQIETAQITGYDYVGGLVGESDDGAVNRCHITGVVKGAGYVGGLVGVNFGSVMYSRSNVEVQGGYWDTGGIAGYNGPHIGYISSCRSEGEISGQICVGGMAGCNMGTIVICLNGGTIRGGTSVGGLVGDNQGGQISYCCSTGDVTGGTSIGGLVGINQHSVDAVSNVINCYSVGRVSGDSCVGGLMGANDDDYSSITHSNVSKSFWDVEASGQTDSAGGEGLTTTQMQSLRTYLDAGWDLVGRREDGTAEIWQMPDGGGYPVLMLSDEDTPIPLKGHGRSDDPYLIGDAYDLGSMLRGDPYAYYRLTTSIDLSGVSWSAAVVPWFAGVFDGNNRAISNLTISGTGYLGLFASLSSGALVRNVTVLDVNIVGCESDIGGLVGQNFGDVSDCYSSGMVSGNSEVGGLIGSNSSLSSAAHVTQCHSEATVTGNWRVGGVVGVNSHSWITSCYSTGAVVGIDREVVANSGHARQPDSARMAQDAGTVTYILVNHDIGGLLGENWYGEMDDCHSTGTVSGTNEIGGLLGLNNCDVATCSSSATVKGSTYVGGLIGNNTGKVRFCYATGSTQGSSCVGGLLGTHDRTGVAIACYSTGSVQGMSDVGGLIGSNNGPVNDCYAGGTVVGTTHVGGLMGGTGGDVTHCYSFGAVTGNSGVGGLIGYNATGKPVCAPDSFWDVQTTGLSQSAGGSGLTTAQMRKAAAFTDAGWDFVNTWTICEGQDYPTLKWEGRPCP